MLKGPVLGPMVLCGVCFRFKDLHFLSQIGVKDSKKLSPKKRNELAKKIKYMCYSHEIQVGSAQEIDEREKSRISLNRLEELKIAYILNKLKPDIIFIDAADVNEGRFGVSISKLLEFTPKKIISKHKADDLYPIVSASSIIAKDLRDKLIRDLINKHGDFGSGYPSDPKSIEFLRNWIKSKKNVPYFARKSWETTKKILNEEINNKKITDYFH